MTFAHATPKLKIDVCSECVLATFRGSARDSPQIQKEGMRFGDEFGRRILISSKLPRLEMEGKRLNLSGAALDKELALLGFNLEKLHKSNDHHKRALDVVQNALTRRGLTYSLEYTKQMKPQSFQGVDFVLCVGGDGTLLETCQYVKTSKTPVLGVNSDPGGSVGKLLSLPTYARFEQAMQRLEANEFAWLMRSRIGATLVDKLGRRHERESILALNEILLAEREVCRPSRHRILLDDEGEDFGIQRSCGLIVATGSGSTAWIHSANAIHAEDVQLLLNCSHDDAMRFAKEANAKMMLDPTSKRMSFFIREILGGERATSSMEESDPVMRKKRRGFANRLRVLALGFDTCIFQDGLTRAVALEHGTAAEFQIAGEERSLRTFQDL